MFCALITLLQCFKNIKPGGCFAPPVKSLPPSKKQPPCFILLGRAWASPTVMWLTEASAMHYGAYVHGTFPQWLKSHRHATGTSTNLYLTCQLCFQVYNFCVNLHGFAFRKTLHISQDVICWQSWSNNNSKYGPNINNLRRSNQMFSCELANLLLTIVAAILP